MFLAVCLMCIVGIFAYYKWAFQYWKKMKAPFLQPNIPFGNCSTAIRGKENYGFCVARFYKEMKQNGWKHGGFFVFTSPNYLVINLDLIKNIMENDFQHFTDRVSYCTKKSRPLDAHLLNLTGTKWRNTRTKLTPTFSTSKMKIMFQTLSDCQVYLLQRMDKDCLKNIPINMSEICTCFTIDVIGSCVFALNCNSLQEKDSPFRLYGRKAFPTTLLSRLKITLLANFPKLASLLQIKYLPKDVNDFFMKLVKDIVDYKQKTDNKRNDFMQLLINLMEEGSLTFEEIAAESFVFFVAGFETSSTVMSFALYELAKNQNIQEKVRREVEEILENHSGDLTYSSLKDMKYLDQVIEETLRMYPPAPILNRRCTKDYKIPNEEIVIKQGTPVVIPAWAIHHDEEYYPDPEKFDPERFNEENRNLRHTSTFLSFGKGLRNCIGQRFGFMQSKVGLVCLISNYKFFVGEKTTKKLTMQPNNMILSPVGGIWLDVKKCK